MINTKLLAQANILIKRKEYAAAEKIYLELLAKDPNDDILQAFLGRLYIRQKKFKGAEKILTNAYNKRKTAPTVAALAHCKYQLRKFDDAVILYEELFRYDPDSIKIYDRIIQAFREMEMYNFSYAYAQKFYSKHPDIEPSMIRLTQSYIDMGRIKDAEEMCAKTIQKYPTSNTAWIIAGTLQEFSYSNEELAQDCYMTAIDYGSKEAYYHLGVSYQKTGQLDKAEKCYLKMIELMPQEIHSQASLGTLYLLQKNIEKGYEYFQKRDKTPEINSLKNLWEGDSRPNDTLLYYCDQGLGDHIQFIRYLPFLAEKFKYVKVMTRIECLDLFKKNYSADKYPNVDFYSEMNKVGRYDCYSLSSDIPLYLKMDFNHIPSSNGYLKCDLTKKDYFAKKYFNTDKYKVGMCWKAGGTGMRAAIQRTINVEYFDKLFKLEKVQFYSFQLDDIFDAKEKYPQMTDITSDLKSFDDTASALANLDLFITADTSCLHLAGALGIKTFGLIPYCADWRWFNHEKSTEWYKSVELFKQKDRRDWYIETDLIYDRLEEI